MGAEGPPLSRFSADLRMAGRRAISSATTMPPVHRWHPHLDDREASRESTGRKPGGPARPKGSPDRPWRMTLDQGRTLCGQFTLTWASRSSTSTKDSISSSPSWRRPSWRPTAW